MATLCRVALMIVAATALMLLANCGGSETQCGVRNAANPGSPPPYGQC